jgi:hypothetical protein
VVDDRISLILIVMEPRIDDGWPIFKLDQHDIC